MHRSPTFLVGARQQRVNLSEFGKEENNTVEATWLRRNVPLCFQAETYQSTHPAKKAMSLKDADACLCSPMMVGVMDGVSQLEDYGMDPSELPQDLVKACEELAFQQLVPEGSPEGRPKDPYLGPVSLLSEAYETTESLGSTTVLLCALDNMTKVHGRTNPMIAVLSIGDCELLLLRRGAMNQPLQIIFHTEMQRIGGNKQAPLQVARVDDRIDPEFDEEIALEVIKDGSAVHCFTAQEGDVVVLGSDGVFDNLYSNEVVEIVNEEFEKGCLKDMEEGRRSKSGNYEPQSNNTLKRICKRIVKAAHDKSGPDGRNAYSLTPIGYGGKIDDTSVVVAEVIEYTKDRCNQAHKMRRNRRIQRLLGCFTTPSCNTACFSQNPPKNLDNHDEDEEEIVKSPTDPTDDTTAVDPGYVDPFESIFNPPVSSALATTSNYGIGSGYPSYGFDISGGGTDNNNNNNNNFEEARESDEEEEEEEGEGRRCSVM